MEMFKEASGTASAKKPGLVVWILVAILVGGVLGSVLPDWGMRALNTFRCAFLDFVKFLVPLIVFTFMVPAIADAGKGAGKMLFLTLGLAYAMTLLAGGFSFVTSNFALPHLVTGDIEVVAAKTGLPPYFTLSLTPVIGIGASVVLAILTGIGIGARGGDEILSLVKQFRDIVSWALSGVVMPLLPVYVMTVVANIASTGALLSVGTMFAGLLFCCIAMSMALVVVQYLVAGALSGHNPFNALRCMLPAYLTGLACCSSAATMPVTLRQAKSLGVNKATAELVVPISANVHLSGSICNMVAFSIGVLILAGKPLTPAGFAQFILQASIVAVAGIPGGMVLASSAIAESLLGISPDLYSIVMVLYMLLDGVGTGCNVIGGGAIAMIVDRYCGQGLGNDVPVQAQQMGFAARTAPAAWPIPQLFGATSRGRPSWGDRRPARRSRTGRAS